MNRASDLEAEGHALIAKGHAILAEAARLRAPARLANDDARPSWIPAAASPLGNRRTLALARAGELESSKVGRKVLVHRASLDRYLDAHRRDAAPGQADGEDLFGAKAS